MTQRKKIVILSFSAIAMFSVLAVVVVLMLRPHIYKVGYAADTSAYQVPGIDISAHNGSVDFSRVSQSGMQFVLIKASEGCTFRDSLFERNHRAASEAGLKLGAYHFFRFDVDGVSQAHNFLSAINGKPLSLPLVIDVETNSNPFRPFPSRVARNLRNMVDELAAYDFPVMLYTNKNGYDVFVSDRFGDCGLWICSFDNPAANMPWSVWQYSHWGTLPGINGNVDLDVFCGDAEQWTAWTTECERRILKSYELMAAINR